MRTNFLMFIVDQLCASHLGCYGNTVIETPNIDGLSARGWQASASYVATPICMPNRASLMTGRVPSSHGVRHNGLPLGLENITFPELMRQAGYATAHIGKSHLQTMTNQQPIPNPLRPKREKDGKQRFPGDYRQESVDNWMDADYPMTLPYYGFEQAEIAIEHGDDINGHYRGWLRQQGVDDATLLGRENALPTDYELAKVGQAWRTRVPEALHPTAWVASRTCDLLEEYAAQDKPFFLHCSFPDPHHPYTPPGQYWNKYRPEDMTLPTSYHSPSPPPHLAWLRAQRDAGCAHKTSMACFAASEREVQEALALNYGSISFIDAQIGQVLRTLSQLGLADNTVVIFTADHGEFGGDHQLLFKGSLHYQSLIRTPFIWADPQRPVHGRNAALLSTIDIAPTILERADVAACNGMQGRSFLPAIEGHPYAERDLLLLEEEGQRIYFGFDAPVRMRTLLTPRHRLSLYEGAAWGELYDRDEDPTESINLWDDSPHQALKQHLLHQLLQQSIAHNDTSLTPIAVA